MTGASGLQEFHYKAHFASRSLLPGAHLSRVAGGGIDVADTVPLLRARDPRRLDLRAALRDPFGNWWARESRQRSSLRVMLLMDVSASVAAGAQGAARQALAQSFALALQQSALRRGDAFGLIGFSHELPEALHVPPSRVRQAASAALAALAALADHAFSGRDASGLPQAALLTPRQPSLVFLLSDFCFAPELLDSALAHLARHDVVPLWMDHEPPRPARHGWLELHDAETGARRHLWMRPSLARRWAAAHDAHGEAIDDCLSRHQRVPLRLRAPFDADAVSDYFAARG